MLVTRTQTRRRSAFSGFNQRKRQTLAIFQERGWMNPATFAALSGMRPKRGVYSYLSRLWSWGLLERKRSARGLILYRLSARGEERLAWLRRGPEAGSSRKSRRQGGAKDLQVGIVGFLDTLPP